MQIEYRIGDLVLMEICGIREFEILDISQEAKTIKFDNFVGWMKASDCTSKILGKIGTVTYKKGFWKTKRIVTRI
jgi:hypothetical protein